MTEKKITVNNGKSLKSKAKPRGKPWPKGVSGNPNGAPRRGESWAELIKRVGEMTPSEAAERSIELAQQLLKIGDGVTLKEAVVMRVYGAMLFEPQPGLFNALMERAEGKVSQPFDVSWRDEAKAQGYDPDKLIEEFARAMVAANLEGSSGAGETSGSDNSTSTGA